MDTVEKFKNALKELKKDLAKSRGYLERQAIYLNRQIDRTAKRVFASYAKEYPKIQADKIQEFIMERELGIEYDVEKQYDDISDRLMIMDNFIKGIQLYIDSFPNGNAKNYYWIDGLVRMLKYLRFLGIMNLEEIATIIGLAVSSNMRYINKFHDQLYDDDDRVRRLRDYFNEDGTFKYNDKIDPFRQALKEIDDDKDYFQLLIEFGIGTEYTPVPLAESLSTLLAKNNVILEIEAKDASALAAKRLFREAELASQNDENTDVPANFWDTVSASFDHLKAMRPLDICIFLEAIIRASRVTAVPQKVIAECLGMLVHIDYQNKNSKTYIESHPKEIAGLMEYFNPDGTFKENPRIKNFEKILESLVNRSVQRIEASLQTEMVWTIPIACASLLMENNEAWRQVRANEKRAAKIERAREELSRYYADGRVIEIPHNIGEFDEILDRCGFSEIEKATIRRHRDNRIKMLGYRVGRILDEEQLQLYIDAEDLMKKLSPNQPDRDAIKVCFADLASIADLLSNELDASEKEYFDLEKRDILAQLKGYIDKYTLSTEQPVGMQKVLTK